MPPAAAMPYKRQFLQAANAVWGLNTPAWLAAQVGQESSWRQGLTSTAGAQGLCQFIPATAAGIEAQYQGLANWGRYSPMWCFYSQALLMRDLYQEFGVDRDDCNGIKFSGAGYNGSPTTLRREIALCVADYPNCNKEHWDENVATKRVRAIHHWKENRSYVSRITARERIYVADGWGVEFCPKSR